MIMSQAAALLLIERMDLDKYDIGDGASSPSWLSLMRCSSSRVSRLC
jgi:hypothetical protein